LIFGIVALISEKNAIEVFYAELNIRHAGAKNKSSALRVFQNADIVTEYLFDSWRKFTLMLRKRICKCCSSIAAGSGKSTTR